MAFEILNSPWTFELNTYFGSGLNNLQTYNIEDAFFQSNVVVLAFIPYDTSLSGGDSSTGAWLATLRRVQSAAGPIQTVAVVYGQNGTNYSQVNDVDISQSIATYGSLNDGDFDTIPILVDRPTSTGNADFISKQYRDTGIFGDPDGAGFDVIPPVSVPHECCIYLLQPWTAVANKFHRITDKWHTESMTHAGYPLHLRHLTPLPDTSDPETVDAHIITRAANLLAADPAVIRTYPADAATVNSVSPVGVVFSQPEETPVENFIDFGLSGTAITGTPTSAVTYTGQDAIENVARVSFTGHTLGDGLADFTAIDSVNTPPHLDHTSSWTVDVRCVPVLSLHDAADTVTNKADILVDVNFSENVARVAFEAAIANSWCTTTNAAVSLDATSPAANDAFYILKVTPTPASFPSSDFDGGDVTLRIPGGVTSDVLGNSNDLSNALTFTFDNVAPPVALDLATGVTEPVSGPFTVDIDFGEPVKGSVTAAQWFDGAAANNCTVGNIVPDPDSPTAVYEQNYTAQVTPTGGSITVKINADVAEDAAGNKNDEVTLSVSYQAPVVSGDHDIVVVIDVSGSMGWNVSVDGGPNQPKIEYVKDALGGFLDKLNLAVSNGDLNADDRVRFVKYATTTAPIVVDSHPWLRLDQLTAPRIQQLKDALTTGGSTAMGDGLALALGEVVYQQSNAQYQKHRHIVLFADGQNNHGATISHNGSAGTETINASPPITLGPDSSWEIPIYTIGIMTANQVASPQWLAGLDELALDTGGFSYAMTDQTVWSQTDQALTAVAVEIYSASSPQEVFSATGTLGAGESTRDFPVQLDRSHHSVIIHASWPGSEALDFSFAKGSATLFPSVPEKTGNKHKIKAYRLPTAQPYRYRFPSSVGTFIFFVAEGKWTLTVRRKSNSSSSPVPYYLSVLGDGRGLRYDLAISAKTHLAGQAIESFLRVKTLGTAASGYVRGSLEVERSRYAPADVLRKYAADLPAVKGIKFKIGPEGSVVVPSKRPEESPQIKRWRQLETHRYAWSMLKERKKAYVHPTYSIFPGRLCWKVADTSVPGIYHLRWKFEGVDAKLGKYVRTDSRSVVVQPRVDIRASDWTMKVPMKNVVEIQFTPRSATKTHLGPGWAESFRVICKSLKGGEITDDLNGSYKILLAFEDSGGAGDTIRIEAAGHTIMKGRLKDIWSADSSPD